MKTPRRGTSDTTAGNSPTRGKKKSEKSRRGKTQATAGDPSHRANAKLRDLPPNENISKRADEVYGDTEIPERKPGT